MKSHSRLCDGSNVAGCGGTTNRRQGDPTAESKKCTRTRTVKGGRSPRNRRNDLESLLDALVKEFDQLAEWVYFFYCVCLFLNVCYVWMGSQHLLQFNALNRFQWDLEEVFFTWILCYSSSKKPCTKNIKNRMMHFYLNVNLIGQKNIELIICQLHKNFSHFGVTIIFNTQGF